jgi:hypothetical protein
MHCHLESAAGQPGSLAAPAAVTSCFALPSAALCAVVTALFLVVVVAVRPDGPVICQAHPAELVPAAAWPAARHVIAPALLLDPLAAARAALCVRLEPRQVGGRCPVVLLAGLAVVEGAAVVEAGAAAAGRARDDGAAGAALVKQTLAAAGVGAPPACGRKGGQLWASVVEIVHAVWCSHGGPIPRTPIACLQQVRTTNHGYIWCLLRPAKLQHTRSSAAEPLSVD